MSRTYKLLQNLILRTYFKTCLNTTGYFITTKSLENGDFKSPFEKGGFRGISGS